MCTVLVNKSIFSFFSSFRRGFHSTVPLRSAHRSCDKLCWNYTVAYSRVGSIWRTRCKPRFQFVSGGIKLPLQKTHLGTWGDEFPTAVRCWGRPDLRATTQLGKGLPSYAKTLCPSRSTSLGDLLPPSPPAHIYELSTLPEKNWTRISSRLLLSANMFINMGSICKARSYMRPSCVIV